MFYFLKDMNTQAGKVYKAGGVVPENFSNPAGLAEMIAAGDIIDVDPEPAMDEPEAFEEPEPFEEEEIVKPIKKKRKVAK